MAILSRSSEMNMSFWATWDRSDSTFTNTRRQEQVTSEPTFLTSPARFVQPSAVIWLMVDPLACISWNLILDPLLLGATLHFSSTITFFQECSWKQSGNSIWMKFCVIVGKAWSMWACIQPADAPPCWLHQIRVDSLVCIKLIHTLVVNRRLDYLILPRPLWKHRV